MKQLEKQYITPLWKDGNKILINSSTLADLQSCPRKAFYRNVLKAVPEPTAAMSFGTLIHKVMEKAYQIKPSDRSQIVPSDLVADCVELTGFSSEEEPRTVKTAVNIVTNYLKTFEYDPYVCLQIAGKPAVEVEFEFPLCDTGAFEIIYSGRIDMITQNTQTGDIVVMDHKTSKTLGKEFISRWNPNHQLTGYIMGAAHLLRKPVSYAIINGLQVAKTVHAICRVSTERTNADFLEFQDTVAQEVDNWLKSYMDYKESENPSVFPMASGMTCSMYSGCQYLEVCSSRQSLRSSLLDSIKAKKEVVTDEAI